MTINEYLATYTLLENLPTEIDYTVFKNRFISLYGTRKIRGDVPVDNIATIAQSVYSVNSALLLPLFLKNISPVLTWSETGDNNDVENGNNSGTNTSTATGSSTVDVTSNTTTVDGTTNTTTDNTTTNTGNNTSSTNNSVYAFNSTDTASPTDSSTTTSNATTTSTGKTTTTATDNSTTTNTGKNTTTDSNSATIENSAKHDITRTGKYNKSGFTLSDYERAFNAFVAPYDYLIRLIVNEICVTSFDLFFDL